MSVRAKGRHGLPFLLAALALVAPPAGAARNSRVKLYLGGGAQYGWVTSVDPAIDGAHGPGPRLVLGARLRSDTPLYFDMQLGGIFVDVGPTPEILYPADRADYSIIGLGGLWDFRAPGSRGMGVWASLHATYHNLNWHTFYYTIDGFGFSPSVGVHVPLASIGVLRIGVTAHFFSARSMYDADAGGRSLLLTLDYLYGFRSRDRT